jgi:hypothetical protein
MKNTNCLYGKIHVRKLLTLVVLLLLSSQTFAGTSRGPITWYLIENGGGRFLFSAGEQNSKAACSNGQWAISLNGPNPSAAKAIMAAVLLAAAQGTRLTVTGTGACDVFGDRETVAFVTYE